MALAALLAVPNVLTTVLRVIPLANVPNAILLGMDHNVMFLKSVLHRLEQTAASILNA